jgi:hypothetical protein
MENINVVRYVQSVYPNATVERVDTGRFWGPFKVVTSNGKELSRGYTKQEAWENAYAKLRNN